MRKPQQTATTLEFTAQNQQWLWGTLFSVPFLAIGLGIIVLSSNLTTLKCDRQECQTLLVSSRQI